MDPPLHALSTSINALPAILETQFNETIRLLQSGEKPTEVKKKLENVQKVWHTGMARVEKEVGMGKINQPWGRCRMDAHIRDDMGERCAAKGWIRYTLESGK